MASFGCEYGGSPGNWKRALMGWTASSPSATLDMSTLKTDLGGGPYRRPPPALAAWTLSKIAGKRRSMSQHRRRCRFGASGVSRLRPRTSCRVHSITAVRWPGVIAAERLRRAGRFEGAPVAGGCGGRHALRGGLGERPQLAGTRWHSTPDSKFAWHKPDCRDRIELAPNAPALGRNAAIVPSPSCKTIPRAGSLGLLDRS
jgi:hypothetical protein